MSFSYTCWKHKSAVHDWKPDFICEFWGKGRSWVVCDVWYHQCSVRLLSQQKTSQKPFLFFFSSFSLYTKGDTGTLSVWGKKIKWLMHRPLVHSFFPLVKLDHLKCWSWMPLSEQTSVRSHLKDQLVLQRPCCGYLVYPELTFNFSLNWKTKITSNQASILTRPHGF